MTLQVALVAKDGILLASDICAMSFYPPNSAAQTYSRRKIVDLPEDKVAYAFSGDDVAEETGRRLEKVLSIRNGFDSSRTRDELERIADEAYAAEKAMHVMMDVHRVLLVVFYQDKPQLWKVDIKDGASRAKEIGDFVA